MRELSAGIFRLDLAGDPSHIVANGAVASEAARKAIAEALRAYAPRAGLDLDVEVTAPFRPATGGFDWEDQYSLPAGLVEPRQVDEGTTIERHPSIVAKRDPAAGATFCFQVDLGFMPDPATQAEPLALTDLPADWQELTIDVEVHSQQLRFEDGGHRRVLTVRRNQASIPATFEAKVAEDVEPGSGVDLLVVFNYKTRFSGIARRSFVAVAGTAPRPLATPIDERVAIVPDARPAALTIKIFSLDTGQGRFLWDFDGPDTYGLGGDARHGEISLGASTDAFARSLLNACPRIPPGQHESTFRGIGEQIWRASPAQFRELYSEMRLKLGSEFPIQLVTDEPHVPWEMMWPEGLAGGDDGDHLYMTHPISRWFAKKNGRMRPNFPAGTIASFVPEYANSQSLPAALEEGRWLVSELGAAAMTATYQAFTDFWGRSVPEQAVTVLHFAGHGNLGDSGVGQIKMLENRWVTCNEVNGGVKLGQRHGTFMVLNACEVGSLDYVLGLSAGWAASLTERGFGGVLAPLWAVQDEHASSVVRAYLKSFMGGTTVGESMLAARRTHRSASATPYAYLCYGDVMAKISAVPTA